MKGYLKLIFALAILGIFSENVSGQDYEYRKNQFAAGIENTRLVYGKYIYNNHITAKLDVSVYSEKLGFQYARGTVGYQTKIKFLELNGEYFFGSAFNGNYFNTGARLEVGATLIKRLLLDVKLVPWYDSGFGYTTCFEALAGCRITRHIDVKVGYTTVPEYRMSEKRFIGGFDFRVSRLSVSPYITMGRNADTGGNNIRVLFGFEYLF